MSENQNPLIFSSLSSFPFSDILLKRPTHVLGEPNNFIIFTHMKSNGVPIYIETPECSVSYTKKSATNGGDNLNPLLKIGKKYFLDILLSDVEWLSWLERIEDLSHQQLLLNQTEWFQTEMTEEDMENLFITPFKMVKGKGGKQFSVRTTFPLDKTLKIFDEKKQQVDYDLDKLSSVITEETRFKAIVQVIGVKCSPRNFYLEMEVKQMMILKEDPVFVKCLISTPVSTNLEKTEDTEKRVETNVLNLQTLQTLQTKDETQSVSKDSLKTNPVESEEKITELLYNDIDEFSLNLSEEKEEIKKTKKEQAIEKMKNIRILGMTDFLKKRHILGEEVLLKTLSQN